MTPSCGSDCRSEGPADTGRVYATKQFLFNRERGDKITLIVVTNCEMQNNSDYYDRINTKEEKNVRCEGKGIERFDCVEETIPSLFA